MPINDLSDSKFFEEEIWIPVFSDTKLFQQAAGCRKATIWKIASSDKGALCCSFNHEIGRIMRSRHDNQNFATISSFTFVAVIAGRMQASDSPGVCFHMAKEAQRGSGSSGKNPSVKTLCVALHLLFVSYYLCV